MMRSYARANACSLWRAGAAIASDDLNGRAANAVNAFLSLIERMARETQGLDLQDKVDHVIHLSGLVDFFKKDKGEKGETRVENLAELVSAAKSFTPDPAEEMSPLDEFLSHAALEAGEGQADAWEDCVQLMTMHSAKGLELACSRTSDRLPIRTVSRRSDACATSALRGPRRPSTSHTLNSAVCMAWIISPSRHVLLRRFPSNISRRCGRACR
jgi:hypothetical protein